MTQDFRQATEDAGLGPQKLPRDYTQFPGTMAEFFEAAALSPEDRAAAVEAIRQRNPKAWLEQTLDEAATDYEAHVAGCWLCQHTDPCSSSKSLVRRIDRLERRLP